jgi:hypothetical protein
LWRFSAVQGSALANDVAATGDVVADEDGDVSAVEASVVVVVVEFICNKHNFIIIIQTFAVQCTKTNIIAQSFITKHHCECDFDTPPPWA